VARRFFPLLLECVINTLDYVAKEARTGLDAVTFEHKAFKAWEAKNAQPAGEGRS